MRFATLVVEPGDRPLEIRVTPLALVARDPLGNVNRWRGQIGLPPVSEAELGSIVKSIDVAGRSVDLVNMMGETSGDAPRQQILAAIVPGDSQVWFFLMLDDAERVSRQADAFESFIRTVRLGDDSMRAAVQSTTGSEPSPPGGLLPPSGSPEVMTWKLPAGWTQDSSENALRVATFRLADPGGEVAITRFPGDVGGLLANINRWRNQLSIPPVSDPAEQPSETIQVAGSPAQLFDISQPGDGAARQRMLVVFLPRVDASWFIKMTGPYSRLDQEETAFREFLATIRLRNDAP
jgi:hypothetical protein